MKKRTESQKDRDENWTRADLPVQVHRDKAQAPMRESRTCFNSDRSERHHFHQVMETGTVSFCAFLHAYNKRKMNTATMEKSDLPKELYFFLK